MTNSIPLAYSLVVDLCLRTCEVKPISNLPGCWEHRLAHNGNVWWLVINGHDEPKHSKPGGPDECMGADVPPCSLCVFRNGWLAGLVDPGGGGMLGESEAELIAALEAAIGVTNG